MTVSHFRELEVWQLSMKLATEAYRLAATFPREERYGLSSRMQRCAVSVPSNIAEGNARASTRDYAGFASMARGSSAKLQTPLLLSTALKPGDDDGRAVALELCDRVGQMLLRSHQPRVRKLHEESRVPSPESRTGSAASRTSEEAEEYL